MIESDAHIISVDVSSIDDYLSNALGMNELLSSLTLYRGQGTRRNLVPGIARCDRACDTELQERAMLQSLKRLGPQVIGSAQTNDIDLMVAAQHHGMKTRLLDWTTNPLAALWFACSSRGTGNAYVYALLADQFVRDDLYTRDPFKRTATAVVLPSHTNARIAAQSGCFTLHVFAKQSQTFVPLERHKSMSDLLVEYVIPSDQRRRILRLLDDCGVNRKTLFPDLDGLCGHINWQFDNNRLSFPSSTASAPRKSRTRTSGSST